MRISKLSLIFRFDKELTEIFKVKDITQSCSKNLMSGVGLSDPLPSVIELRLRLLMFTIYSIDVSSLLRYGIGRAVIHVTILTRILK